MDQPAVSAKNKQSFSTNRVAKEVLDVIIDGLNSGEMPLAQAQQAARETLATISKIEKHEESILDFYKNLSEKYPVFEILYTRVKSEIIKSRELSHYHRALSAIDAGDFVSAHQIAKTALSQTAHETKDVR